MIRRGPLPKAGATSAFNSPRMGIELFLCGALTGGGAGFGTLGRPIFWRKGDAPELRARGRKFQANFGFVATDGPEEYDLALLFLESFFVLKPDYAAAGDSCLQKDQSAMCADGKGFGFLVEGSALRVRAAKTNRDLHENALAAALWTGMCGCVGNLGHAVSLSLFYRRRPRFTMRTGEGVHKKFSGRE